MKTPVDSQANYKETERQVGYVPRAESTPQTYSRLGFKCGLEVHQQLKTEKKLFCRCPAGIYQKENEFDAEVIRHMRPTLSELGEYDGTALMEFKTRKNIIYRIKNETTCTYDIDDTPPFLLNRQALDIALEIALLLKTKLVGELHITRKQYLDGSIPTGFQRTAIVGIDGDIPLKHKKVGILQLSIEEDACREVLDVGHWRIYTTDRLGIPLVETVTYPDLLTPDEAAEAAHYIRFLTRSTDKVRTGIGATREDVNVSVEGGTRVEIKGVAHIRRIPELTHNEAFRQEALLEIKKILCQKMGDPESWKLSWQALETGAVVGDYIPLRDALHKKQRILAINLPGFRSILSHFTQPGKTFADELSDRLKVIACLEKPNLAHSEPLSPWANTTQLATLRQLLKAADDDAQLLVWGPEDDMPTALETIEERCRLAFSRVPNETRKALPDGTTLFERVLPGPDRMYPDTDSAPIPISENEIQSIRRRLPIEVEQRFCQLQEWQIPEDSHAYLLKLNLVPLIERISADCPLTPKFVGTLLGHCFKHLQGQGAPAADFTPERIHDLLLFITRQNLDPAIAKAMLPVVVQHPHMDLHSVLTTINFKPVERNEILAHIPLLREKFKEIKTSNRPGAETRWIMGNLRKLALGNLPLGELRSLVEKGVGHG